MHVEPLGLVDVVADPVEQDPFYEGLCNCRRPGYENPRRLEARVWRPLVRTGYREDIFPVGHSRKDFEWFG